MTNKQENSTHSTSTGTLEQFELMLRKYQAMDELVDSMLKKQAIGESIQTEMETLNKSREELAIVQSQATTMRRLESNSGSTKSTKIKNVVDRTSSLIEGLVAKIEVLENSARESFEKLVPAVDKQVRSNMMKQAYQQRTT